MRALIRKNLLILVIALATVMSLLIPGVGQVMSDMGLIPWTVVLIFLCQGAGLDASEAMHPGRYVRAVGWGAVVSLGAAPLLGLIAVNLLGWHDDDRVGFLLMCCMAPTLVSGIVIAVQAGGDRTSAVILTVLLNLVAIFTIPLNLSWTLGSGAMTGHDQLDLLKKLVLLILIPAAIGQLFRRRFKDTVVAHKTAITLTPIIALGLTVFISLCKQVDELRLLTFGRVLVLALPALVVHLILLALAYAGARWIMRLPVSSRRSVALVCSQKTLPVAVAVWSTQFAKDYPTAILAPIIFHMSQIYCDGIIARFWAGDPEKAAAAAAAKVEAEAGPIPSGVPAEATEAASGK